jgi:hypothetical protein
MVTWILSPAVNPARYVEATPRNGLPEPDRDLELRTDHIIPAVDGSAIGVVAMEYCRRRMGGSMAMKLAKESFADGNSSRTSRTERRLRATQLSKSRSRARIASLVASSDALTAIFAIF